MTIITLLAASTKTLHFSKKCNKAASKTDAIDQRGITRIIAKTVEKAGHLQEDHVARPF